MPIRKAPFINGYFYHVYNRGVNKQSIFDTSSDYLRMVDVFRYYRYQQNSLKFSSFLHLSKTFRKVVWDKIGKSNKYIDIISYCLMPNHFHLLLKQNVDDGISKFLANIQNAYTRYFNIRHDRTGHLFQGQFKSVLISSNEQLNHVSRYIHLNPCTSGAVKSVSELNDYKWSSLKEYSKNVDFPICEKEILLRNFKSSEIYLKFVHDNADYQKQLEETKHLVFDQNTTSEVDVN